MLPPIRPMSLLTAVLGLCLTTGSPAAESGQAAKPSLSTLSLEVEALQALYDFKLTPAQMDVLRKLALEETTYGWAVEMILKGTLHGFRVVEVPVSYHPRIGKSKISGTVTGTLGAAWFIFSRILLYYVQRRRAGAPELV